MSTPDWGCSTRRSTRACTPFRSRPVRHASISELVRLYLLRGWVEQAVERAMLLDRLLGLDPNEAVLAELRQLAASNAAVDTRLAALGNGAQGDQQPV